MRDINHYALMHYTLRIFFNFNLEAQGFFGTSYLSNIIRLIIRLKPIFDLFKLNSIVLL